MTYFPSSWDGLDDYAAIGLVTACLAIFVASSVRHMPVLHVYQLYYLRMYLVFFVYAPLYLGLFLWPGQAQWFYLAADLLLVYLQLVLYKFLLEAAGGSQCLTSCWVQASYLLVPGKEDLTPQWLERRLVYMKQCLVLKPLTSVLWLLYYYCFNNNNNTTTIIGLTADDIESILISLGNLSVICANIGGLLLLFLVLKPILNRALPETVSNSPAINFTGIYLLVSFLIFVTVVQHTFIVLARHEGWIMRLDARDTYSGDRLYAALMILDLLLVACLSFPTFTHTPFKSFFSSLGMSEHHINLHTQDVAPPQPCCCTVTGKLLQFWNLDGPGCVHSLLGYQ